MKTTEERQRAIQLLAILGASAVMHLVPQVSDYFVTMWMTVGLGGAVFLSLMLLAPRTQLQLDPLTRFHGLLLIAYLVHQFEEHGVDLRGRTYFFITSTRTRTRRP
jgi:hypothetical protein